MKLRATSSQLGLVVSVFDQAGIAASTFLVAVWFAQGASAKEFGYFSLAQLGFITIVGVSRATAGLSTTVSAASNRAMDVRASYSLALSLGMVGVLLGSVGWVLFDDIPTLGESLLLFGLCLPPYLIIDCARCEWHASGRNLRALTASGAIALVLVMAWIWPNPPQWFPSALGGYFLALMVGLLVVIPGLRLSSPPQAWALVGRERFVWRGSLTSFAVNSVGIIGVPLVVAAVGSVPAAGGLRAAQAVAGLPLQVPQGLQLVALARSQRDILSGGDARGVARAWLAFHGILFTLMVPAALVVPDSWGMRAFGEVWRLASGALPVVVLASGAAACTLGIELYARVVGRTGAIARIRAIAIAPTLALAGVGVAVAGVVGAAIGLLVGQGLLLSLALRWFLKGKDLVAEHPHGPLPKLEE